MRRDGPLEKGCEGCCERSGVRMVHESWTNDGCSKIELFIVFVRSDTLDEGSDVSLCVSFRINVSPWDKGTEDILGRNIYETTRVRRRR